MDLAKIRKKSLQSLEKDVAPRLATPASLPDLAKQPPDAVAAAPISAEVDFFNSESYPVPVASIGEVPLPVSAIIPVRAAACTPLEAILAGRTAAGCDDESVLADDVTSEVVTESCLEFLCFRVSDEIYGINIMDIKEIIKPREVTEVPRAPHFVSGILSLRGTIIPIIDMRVRLGLDRAEPTGKERIIVIKNNNSLSGLLVDEVIQVVQVPQDAVEAAPTVLDGIDRDFVSGLGRSEGRLIIILHLENIADIDLY
jgi:purine-binding chemotaxis protein CheW